jgi:aspartyl-tRNA synthetase
MGKMRPMTTNRYRTHTCGELRSTHAGARAKLAGWVHRRRDHGNLLFLDLRDHYGIAQCVIDVSSPLFKEVDGVRLETVISVEGQVVKRSAETINAEIPTGEVELRIEAIEVLSRADTLPLQVNSDVDYGEEVRLKYRFLDLRREKVHKNIVLRTKVIASIRRRMIEAGFTEFSTPILTASSPEGARDFLVPSRLHHGEFYALPQAPQIFKQLIMVAGFDRYFQIAPCYRDEDARADRSPGEFYQLEFEMRFVTQEDVFAAIEPVIAGVFEEFANGRAVTKSPFPRIPYDEAMLKYGSDKPDLRNPLLICDATDVWRGTEFKIFAGQIDKGAVVRAIRAPGAASRPRSFFDKLNDWARAEGQGGLGYIVFEGGEAKGPIARFLDATRMATLKSATGAADGDAVFFVCNEKGKAALFAGQARTRLGEEMDLIAKNRLDFCWIVDFPMYEWDDKLKKIDFSHNPFSMPQGGLEALETKDPLEIKAFQYDIVCNGVELSSGAIRNHLPEVMIKAFEIAGYKREEVEARFSGLLNAFRYGAPPHGGSAPGIDRIVMLIADEPNIREVTMFPMNQQAQDLMMGAPAPVPNERLIELGLRLAPAPKKN